MDDTFKVIIAGGRDFNNYNILEKYCNYILQNKINVEIVCGLARGADKLGKIYAEKNKLKISYFPAEWDKHGKSAGYLRNNEMANYADSAIIFWDGKSKGSKNMIELAKSKNLLLRIYKY